MADQWLNIYHQNLSNQPPLLSDHEVNNSESVSDSTVVTAAATTPPASGSSLSPDGRVGKPVRKRSRASRRTPTTLLNTDAANFRAMVQQFTGGPTSNNVPNFTFGFPGSSHPVYDPAAAAYHLPDPPQQAQMFQYQSQPPPPPFMFPLGNSPASEAFGGGSRSNVADYMGLFDGPSPPPPHHHHHHHPRPS